MLKKLLLRDEGGTNKNDNNDYVTILRSSTTEHRFWMFTIF